MTPEQELVKRCTWVAGEISKAIIGQTRLNPDIYLAKGSGDLLYRVRLHQIGHWMNSGERKEYLFNMIRLSVEAAGYDCVIISTEAWMLKENDKFHSIPTHEGKMEIANRGVTWMVDNGYGERIKTFIVSGQTAEHAYLVGHPFDRNDDDIITAVHPPTHLPHIIPQADFSGRQKMFGPQSEGMAEMYEFLKSNGLSEDAGRFFQAAATMINIATESTV